MNTFIVFMQQFMPSEKSVICSIFQLSNDIDELSHNFCLIFDIFRQTSMQVVDLDFVNMNARAHIAIEKCNRLIKGKNRPFRTSDPGARVGYDDSLLRTTMVAPVFAHPAYATSLACFRDSGWQHLLQVRAVHGLVRVWELPANLVAIQARCILEMLQTNSNNIVYSTLLYVCLRCVSRSVKFVINKKMRVMSDESCYCSQCNCISFVIPVSVLGRVVQIHDTYPYFCHFSCCTHEWSSSGHEFTSCAHSTQAQPLPGRQAAKTCAICTRTTSLSTCTVLDDQLGMLADISLCAKHKPLAHQNDIYDDDCFYYFQK